MGTSGVPWNVDKNAIIAALKHRKGRITFAAKDLNVHHCTLRKKINADPELMQIMEDERQAFDTLLLDSGEDCLLYAISKRDTDLPSALKSSFYILNNKGRSRGYSPKCNEGSIEIHDPREIAQALAEYNSEVSRVQVAGKSSLEAEPSILDQGCGGEENSFQTELGPESPLGGDA